MGAGLDEMTALEVWATLLKGGRAVGVWNSKKTDGTFSVEVEEFSPLSRADRTAVGNEVDEMAAFQGQKPELGFAT
jgi:hypothetical protein